MMRMTAIPLRRKLREKRLAFAVCEACRGSGKDTRSERCRPCGGSGRITVEIDSTA